MSKIKPLDENDYKLKSEKEIAKELRKIRITQLNLTQESIAKLCGITRTAWGHYEKGRCLPGRERMVKIAALANKTVQEIFYDIQED
ncbi:helix-turn-helix transcriptional regulator (plasmid) [Finegoldia magna]|uniref:helix-turn-helix transcriptional regulator n=1 Tax=Finegoldia magna TaxID=1260 RepID=UPI00370D9393